MKRIKTLIGAVLILIMGITSSMASNDIEKKAMAPISIEAEVGFENIGDQAFSLEERPFYSGGAAIKIKGSVPEDSKAKVRYDLGSSLTPGEYTLRVYYLDENDGHSPVNITIGNEVYTIVFDEDTESGFDDEVNLRDALIPSVIVKANDHMIVEGQVYRYNSEHKELVRLDKFVFTSKQD